MLNQFDVMLILNLLQHVDKKNVSASKKDDLLIDID